jgi:putative ABC transport system permease protein
VRLAVNRLLRQPWSTLSQLSAFSLSFMLLALLLVLRGDLLDRWQQQLPPESPNYFLINIAPEQVTPLKASCRSITLSLNRSIPSFARV